MRKGAASLLRHAAAIIMIASGLGLAAGAVRAEETITIQDTVFEFDIKGETLGKALAELSKQARTGFLYPYDLADSREVHPVAGRMTVLEALNAMLRDTPFSAGLTTSEVIVVSRREQEPEGKMATKNIKKTLMAGAAAFLYGTGAYAADVALIEDEDSEQAEGNEKDVILVTGSNIRGAGPVGSQLLTFDRSSIEATGLATMPEFLETLPQNFGLVGSDGSPGGAAGLPNAFANQNGGSSLNLRGLGQGTTLTLLNGRRMALGFQGTAVDVSAIPLTAIERVEVLTDGASAIYGSDAIGGVVNFELRDDFEGAETTFRYGRASDVDEYRAAQSLGGAWGSGHALASFQYFSRDNLASADRSISDGADLRDLLPEDEQYSAVLAGAQDIGDAAEFFFDG